jgi:hypothetical protein
MSTKKLDLIGGGVWGAARKARAVQEFVETAKANNLEGIRTRDQIPNIGVWLKDGTDVPALAVAEDGFGNWTVLRASDLKVVQYLRSDIL